MDAAQEIGELRIDARSQMNFAHLTGDHNPVQVDVAVGRSVELRKCHRSGMNVVLSAIERYLAAAASFLTSRESSCGSQSRFLSMNVS
jgi:acyl dehydratase